MGGVENQKPVEGNEVFNDGDKDAVKNIEEAEKDDVVNVVGANDSLNTALKEMEGEKIPRTEKGKFEWNKNDFRNRILEADTKNILSLNDENIDDLFADYVKQLDTYLVNEYNNTNKQFKRTNVKPLEISQDDYINISESFKQKCVLDVLKPLYIGYVVTNITDINKIFDGKKVGLKNEEVSGSGTYHEYPEKVINEFEEVLSLASTDSESVYNLAEYIHYLKEEKKAEAQGKLALFLLKPINDMTDSYGVRRPTQFVFEKGGKLNTENIDLKTFTKNEDKQYTQNDGGLGDNNMANYKYILEDDIDDKNLTINYNAINKKISSIVRDNTYTYTLTVPKLYEKYIDVSQYGNNLTINFTEGNVLKINGEKEVINPELKSINAKIKGLEFNTIPTNDQIEEKLKKDPNFDILLSDPEKYVINSCVVTGSASHVPTDYNKSLYPNKENIISEKLLDSQGSEENKLLAKDRAYAYVNYLNQSGLTKGSNFDGFAIQYGVHGKLYDPKEFEELSPTEIEEKMKPYYEEQYANIELKYQEKEIKTIEHDLTDVPDIETSPGEIISFGYKIPPYQGLSQARIDANNMKK